MNSQVRKTVVDHIGTDPVPGLISYAADNNPWGVYRAIQRIFPGKFDQWDRGFEESEAAKQQMVDFLIARTKETTQPLELVIAFVKNVPFNPFADNWTTKPQS